MSRGVRLLSKISFLLAQDYELLLVHPIHSNGALVVILYPKSVAACVWLLARDRRGPFLHGRVHAARAVFEWFAISRRTNVVAANESLVAVLKQNRHQNRNENDWSCHFTLLLTGLLSIFLVYTTSLSALKMVNVTKENFIEVRVDRLWRGDVLFS